MWLLFLFFSFLVGCVLNVVRWDSPGGPVVKNPPSNAGDTGFIPARGTKIPHATGQLSPWPQLLSMRATTTEPMCSGACGPQLEREVCTPQQKIPHAKEDPTFCN